MKSYTKTVAGVIKTLGLLMIVIGMTASAAAPAKVVDRIVAVVNDDIIRLVELNKAVEPFEKEIRAKHLPPEEEKKALFEARKNMLDNMIDDALTDQKIKEFGITVSEAEVDEAIERIKAMNYYTDEQLRHALTASGYSMEDYRGDLKKQILRNKLVTLRVKSNIVITHSDIQAYYDAHPEIYGGKKKYRLCNIIMRFPPYADEETKNQIYQKMVSVRKQLKSGRPFRDVARACSEAVNAKSGGELGLFALDDLSEVIRKEVCKMKPGDISSVIDTDTGYQIFYLEEIVQTKAKPLADVSDKIEQKLYEQEVNVKFQEWIKKLRENAEIRVNL